MKKCSRSKAHLALRAVYIVFQVLDDAALQNRMLLNTFEGGEVGQSGMMVGQRLPKLGCLRAPCRRCGGILLL